MGSTFVAHKKSIIMQEFDLNDLKRQVSEKTGLKLADVDLALESAFTAIGDALKNHGRVELHHFGTFKVKTTSERSGVLNGEAWVKPAGKKISFGAAPALKKMAGV